jgi:hypothetical protein
MVTAAAACAVAATAIPASAAVAASAAPPARPAAGVPAGAAAAGAAGQVTKVPRGLLPLSASWLTPRDGVVLAYPSRTTGARPYLLQTWNGGESWRTLPPPPVTYPADNDEPDVVWSGGVIAVTNGTRIVTTSDSGGHWTAVRIPGVPGSSFVAQLVIADGRLYVLVNTGTSASVYSGPARSDLLRPVRGLAISGASVYGSITDSGALQVDLGNDYVTQKYWYSRNGVRFTAAPLPCAAADMTFLGGVRQGRVVALCATGPSSAGPGETEARLSVAPRLGGRFAPAGQAAEMPNVQEFAAATARDVTAATTGYLEESASAGATWKSELTQGNGAFWNDLEFPTATTGFIVCSTVSSSLRQTATLYRTTDSGRTWRAVPVP